MSQLIDTEVYAARMKDRDILLKSASGGAFTAVSDVFLNRGDAVACCVYDYEKNIAGFQLLFTKEERDAARGSKYMQSNSGSIYRQCMEWLKANPDKKLLFVGMGCQAAGFRRFVDAKGIGEQVYVADIICHGSPSPLLWTEYINVLEKKHAKNNRHAEYITFKDKRNGWKAPTAVAVFDGKEVSLGEYVKVFYNRCALRPSCHKCPYAATERYTDLTIGDYWHIEEKLPDFYDPMGNSLILLHTEKGRQLFEKMKYSMDYCRSNTTDCWQINLERPTAISEKRDAFWMDYQQRGIGYIMKKYGKTSMSARIKSKMKNIFRGGGIV